MESSTGHRRTSDHSLADLAFPARGVVEMCDRERVYSATAWAEAASLAGRGSYRKRTILADEGPQVIFEFENEATAVEFALLF